MKRILQLISIIALLLTIVPPVLFFTEKITQNQQNFWMLIGAIVWFASALFWLGKKSETSV